MTITMHTTAIEQAITMVEASSGMQDASPEGSLPSVAQERPSLRRHGGPRQLACPPGHNKISELKMTATKHTAALKPMTTMV